MEQGKGGSSAETVDGGYRQDEALNFIEFCIELNNQDDRQELAAKGAAPAALEQVEAQIDPALWNPTPLFDSRKKVAADYVRFRSPDYVPQPGEDDLSHWKKLFVKLEERAAAKGIAPLTQQRIENCPDLNGFGPWQNAWLLYRGVGVNAGRYAVAIRGTVFSNAPSAVEDAYFQPVRARHFLSGAVSFASNNEAALHSGFAHATFTTLLDRRYGILPVLQDLDLPIGTQLYLVGHSQGAAMATLIHAFLLQAANGAAFGLRDKQYRCKSYAFAQPKPGTDAFAADFARRTQAEDTAIVINNHLDSVPNVPFTLESLHDLENAFPAKNWVTRLIRWVSGFSAAFRSRIGAWLEPRVRNSAKDYGYFYRYDQLKPLSDVKADDSWYFLPAGRLIRVFGSPTPPDKSDDLFYQHHATTYRELIRAQLGRRNPQ